MSTVLITGGTGLVGRFIAEHFLRLGNRVVAAGRTPPTLGFFSGPVRFVPFSLDPKTDYHSILRGVDTLIHCAFDHAPGRYRGGEGDDPAAFVQKNQHGTGRLFTDAKIVGVPRAVFLSTRAVYGSPPPGTSLDEANRPAPDTLYGETKLRSEQELAALSDSDFVGTSVRVTGVYGPAGKGRDHKWADLYKDYLSGKPIAARAATEVHGDDVASAIGTIINAAPAQVTGKVFNVSDVIADTHDILSPLAELLPNPPALPERGDKTAVSAMTTARLKALGWQPGGEALFKETTATLAKAFVDSKNH